MRRRCTKEKWVSSLLLPACASVLIQASMSTPSRICFRLAWAFRAMMKATYAPLAKQSWHCRTGW
jgi:hypothetical protein